MKVATVKLPDELHMELKLYAVKHGITVSDLIRQKIEELLETERQEHEKTKK